MKARVVYLLMVLVMGFAGSAMAGGPVAVSPGGGGSLAVIGQECPTFSWSQVEGAVSYRLKVFEKVGEGVGSYEAMEKMGGPAVSVEINAPALSWTPSQEECLVSGGKYEWYVGAVGSDGVERWSEGRGFEVEVSASVGMRDAVKETVKEYLTKEWITTESYQGVKESITSQVTKEVKGAGGGVLASPTPLPQAAEGAYNTFYGTDAGHNAGSTSQLYDTFIGAGAGFLNIGSNNTFLGYSAGILNGGGSNNTFLGYLAGGASTGSGNVFIGYRAGHNETGGSRLYIDNSDTPTPLIEGNFYFRFVVINGILSVASSREYKENIDQLKPEKAVETLQQLNPVEFSYKATPSERHTGFISEEVPESLTTKDRKAVSPMDIVAVLTKVVQEQQKMVEELKSENNGLKAKNESLENRLLAIERMVIAPQ